MNEPTTAPNSDDQWLVCFRVNGTPKAQPRPRAVSMGGRARMYDPGTADEWKHDVTQQGHHRMPKQPYTCPLAVRLIFYLPRPQRLSRRCDPAHALPCTTKPDVDNLAKSTLDAMTEAGWWTDDALVAELHVVKLYAAKEARIGALIEVASFHLEPMETV